MSRLRGPVLWFTVGFAFLQAIWIITVPPFRGIDEFDHAYRAAAVAHGEWTAGGVPEDGRGLLVAVPPDLVEAAHAQCAELAYTRRDNCNAAGDAGDNLVFVASAAATYHPVYYWAVGSVGRTFTGAGNLYAMRVVSALLCLAFVGIAAWTASRWPGPWALLGLAVALTPVLAYSTTVVAPNGLEMAAGVALWLVLLRLRVEADGRTSGRLILLATISAGMLATLRWLGPGWVLLIVASVALYDARGLWAAIRRHSRPSAVGALVVLVAAVNTVVWFATEATGTGMPSEKTEEELNASYPVVWALQTIAAYPYRDQSGPPLVYGVVGAFAIAFVVAGVRLGSPRARLAVGVSLLGALVIPVVLTVLTMGLQGIIWQGRYGLAYSVGFVLLAAIAVAERRPTVHLPLVGSAAGAAAMAAGVAWSVVKVRADELSQNNASAADPAWHTPSPVLLCLLALAAHAAMLAALFRAQIAGARADSADPDQSRPRENADSRSCRE